MEGGLRQSDLADLLGVARSTIANVEVGRWTPSERLWGRIVESLPAWVERLEASFNSARRPVIAPSIPADLTPFLGGPFELHTVTYAYLFEESRSPHEIIEVRRVRTISSGATAYGLRLAHTQAPGFVIDQQVLWGGTIAHSVHEDDSHGTAHWTRVEFGKSLRAGQRHEFATRTWVERDPDPQTAICFNMTIPVRHASLHLAFHGNTEPARMWRYGPLADEQSIPTSHEGQRGLKLVGGNATLTVPTPEIGGVYGVAWSWEQ